MDPSAYRICILSEYAYPIFQKHSAQYGSTDDNSSRVGGAEVQMVMLARELYKRSYPISFIVSTDQSRDSCENIDGIEVYSPVDDQNVGVRYFYPRNMIRILRTLQKIDADIYIQRAGAPLTCIIGLYAKVKGKKFVFSSSSDLNVSHHLRIGTLSTLKNVPFRIGIQAARCVICQTSHQRDLLRRYLRKTGIVIKNMYTPPGMHTKNIHESRRTILWVGRITQSKQPELFIDLARQFPDRHFVMIGPPGKIYLDKEESEYYSGIKNTALEAGNIEFFEFIPRESMDEFYRKALMLVSTSASEGFPNTFLEAWGNCTPVVSLHIDPDQVIQKFKAGVICENFDKMTESIRNLLENEPLRVELGSNGRRYVEQEHDVGNIMEQYQRLFSALMKNEGKDQE